jgi:putative flippase GtrA
MSQLTCEQEKFNNQSQRTSRRMANSALSGELLRYLAVSAAALAVDFCLLFVLSEGLGAHYLVANPIAFTLGAAVAYLGSIHWAFRHRKVSHRGLELAIFIAIGVGGLAVNEAMLWIGIEVAALTLLFAKAIAAMTSFGFNFIIRKIFLFSA